MTPIFVSWCLNKSQLVCWAWLRFLWPPLSSNYEENHISVFLLSHLSSLLSLFFTFKALFLLSFGLFFLLLSLLGLVNYGYDEAFIVSPFCLWVCAAIRLFICMSVHLFACLFIFLFPSFSAILHFFLCVWVFSLLFFLIIYTLTFLSF